MKTSRPSCVVKVKASSSSDSESPVILCGVNICTMCGLFLADLLGMAWERSTALFRFDAGQNVVLNFDGRLRCKHYCRWYELFLVSFSLSGKGQSCRQTCRASNVWELFPVIYNVCLKERSWFAIPAHSDSKTRNKKIIECAKLTTPVKNRTKKL